MPRLNRAIVEAGPDTGRFVDLAGGRHVVGRAPHAALVLTDRTVEPHHVQIDIGEHDGQVTVRQLSGRLAITDRPIAEPGIGRLVEMGASRIRIGDPVGVSTTPPAPPEVRLGGASLDDQLRRARMAFREQQYWLGERDNRRACIGIGALRARVDLLDEHGESLTVSDFDFADQARFDDGLLVSDVPVLVRRARRLAVCGADADQLARLNGLGFTAVEPVSDEADVAGYDAVLEVGDRWRATYVDLVTGSAPIHLHLALPPGS